MRRASPHSPPRSSRPSPRRSATRAARGGSGMGNLAFGYIVAFLLYMMIVLYGQNILRGVWRRRPRASPRSWCRAFRRTRCWRARCSAWVSSRSRRCSRGSVLTLGMLFYLGPLLFSGMGKASAATRRRAPARGWCGEWTADGRHHERAADAGHRRSSSSPTSCSASSSTRRFSRRSGQWSAVRRTSSRHPCP